MSIRQEYEFLSDAANERTDPLPNTAGRYYRGIIQSWAKGEVLLISSETRLQNCQASRPERPRESHRARTDEDATSDRSPPSSFRDLRRVSSPRCCPADWVPASSAGAEAEAGEPIRSRRTRMHHDPICRPSRASCRSGRHCTGR